MKSGAIFLGLAACLLLSGTSRADDSQGQRVVKGVVYKYRDADGVVYYSNVGCPPRSECKMLFTYTETVGSPWSHIFRSTTGGHLVRKGSVEREGNFASDWVLLNFQEPYGVAPGKTAKSQLTYWTADCSSKMLSSRDSVLFSEPDGTGENVAAYTAASPFYRAVPGTLGEALVKHLCQQSVAPPGAA